MDENGREQMVCMLCGYDPGWVTHAEADVCPRCDNTQWMKADAQITMRGRSHLPGTSRRQDVETLHGHGVSRETGHPVGIVRVVDRRRNRYFERVVDKITGEDLRLVDELLSEHRGRGNARPRSEP